MIRLSITGRKTPDIDEAWKLCRDGWVVIGRDAAGDSFLMRRLQPETAEDYEKIYALADELPTNKLVMLGRVQTVCHPVRAKELAAEGYVRKSVHYTVSDGSAAAWTMAPLKVCEI